MCPNWDLIQLFWSQENLTDLAIEPFSSGKNFEISDSGAKIIFEQRLKPPVHLICPSGSSGSFLKISEKLRIFLWRYFGVAALIMWPLVDSTEISQHRSPLRYSITYYNFSRRYLSFNQYNRFSGILWVFLKKNAKSNFKFKMNFSSYTYISLPSSADLSTPGCKRNVKSYAHERRRNP